jgi:hypothetical protein
MTFEGMTKREALEALAAARERIEQLEAVAILMDRVEAEQPRDIDGQIYTIPWAQDIVRAVRAVAPGKVLAEVRRQAAAEAWDRGFMFSYALEHGDDVNEGHSMPIPWHLVENIVEWNPHRGLAPCADHNPVQHRDGKPPWCKACGRTADGSEPVSRFDRKPERRLRACVEAWPEASPMGYHPNCCRFPKSCSCTGYDPETVADEDLEPA